MHSHHRPPSPPPPPLRPRPPVAAGIAFPVLPVVIAGMAIIASLMALVAFLAVSRDAPLPHVEQEAEPFSALVSDGQNRRDRGKDRVAEQERLEQEKQAAAATQAAGQARADEAKRQEEEERQAAMAAEKQGREQDVKQRRAAEAFAALQKMPAIVVQDLVAGGDLGTRRVAEVDLGPFDVEALIEPGFALAVPREVYDGTPFNAWIDSAQDEKHEWRVLVASRPMDGAAARHVRVANITARDGNLYLAAADATTAKNPLFRLLRRSVLLVKARDPAKPDGDAPVQRAIQLVRPASGLLQWQVSLVEERKVLSLPRPIGITAGTPPPALPLDSRVAYEVRFDYPLQYVDGKPLRDPVVYPFEASEFCPLLECPANASQPNQKPSVGLKVDIALNEGVVAVRPEVHGAPVESFGLVELAELAEWVKKSDLGFEDFVRKAISPLKLTVAAIRRQPVATFRGSLVEKKMRELINAQRSSLEDFFAEQGLFFGNDRVGQWIDACDEITGRAAANEWAAALAPLDAWLEHYEGRMRDELGMTRQALKPVSSPATVVVTEISSPAYDVDGKRYDVVLAAPADDVSTGREPGQRRPAGADLD